MHDDKHAALDDLLENDSAVSKADIVIAKNFGTSKKGVVEAFSPLHEGGDEYWHWVFEWDPDTKEFVFEDRTHVHDLTVFDADGGIVHDDHYEE